MNLQTEPPKTPLKVLMVNSLVAAAQQLEMKILAGSIFGEMQLIDLILLVYSNENEEEEAKSLKLEFEKCAFRCMNTIEIMTDLPRITDADVFCFITNIPNPNLVNFDNADIEALLNSLLQTIQVAKNFVMTDKKSEFETENKKNKEEQVSKKPIIVADGLLAIDVINSLSKDLPTDILFCPSPLPAIAKSVIADYLKVNCNLINDVLVWAVNDTVFHVEVEKPLIILDKSADDSNCSWNMIGKDLLEFVKLDHSQFSPSWMKKEYIEMIAALSAENPYGPILKASVLGNCLKKIWSHKDGNDGGKKVNTNMGVISDGSLGTIKGCPYVLPIVLSENLWTVDERFRDSVHLKGEIQRMNTVIQAHHGQLIHYCKRFLEDTVMKEELVSTII